MRVNLQGSEEWDSSYTVASGTSDAAGLVVEGLVAGTLTNQVQGTVKISAAWSCFNNSAQSRVKNCGKSDGLGSPHELYCSESSAFPAEGGRSTWLSGLADLTPQDYREFYVDAENRESLTMAQGKARVVLKAPLDYEAILNRADMTSYYTMTLVVADVPTVRGAEPKSAKAELRVILSDANDAPFFVGPYACEIDENSAAGTHICTLFWHTMMRTTHFWMTIAVTTRSLSSPSRARKVLS